jgi:hypothetical protein
MPDERPEICERARQIDAWLEERGVQTLASYGVGGAVLELWLERLSPERQLRLTDYAPAPVERLRELLPSAEVTRHDLVVDALLEADMHLFHRIDTELANREWRQVLGRFGHSQSLLWRQRWPTFRTSSPRSESASAVAP